MKKYMDIEAARIESTELRASNVDGFTVGEHVQVTVKVDGSNASAAWEDGHVIACSRNKVLDYNNNLNGFWQYATNLGGIAEWFMAGHQDMIIFGEWNLGGNKIKDYKPEFAHNHWIVYDVFNTSTGQYLPQEDVREICDELGLTYIHVLYDGPFISWDHVKQFLENDGYYGPTQEGVVCKSQDRLDSNDSRQPYYVKIVNEAFKESMKTKTPKIKSELEIADEANCQNIVDTIVTKRRVEKAIEKLRDDGDLPVQLTPQDMGAVARLLPKFVYEDCVKEEKELVDLAGSLFGKMCGSKTMQYAREIIIG